MVTIKLCQNKKELRLFERVPELLHGRDPNFVPPFPGSIAKMFSPEFPLARHGRLFPFIAFQDGRPVGRIAAIINKAHNEYYKDKTGFFGFLDSVDSKEVFLTLLKSAEKILLDEGSDSMRGPYNPTSNDESGLLIEGFDSPPFIMMPYNPSYYLDLYDSAGLKPIRTLFAFSIRSNQEVPEQVLKIVEEGKKEMGLSFRSVNMKDLKNELRIFTDIYNKTLDRNFGFVPITYEDTEYAAADLRNFVNPEMFIIAEKDGVPIGFSMTLPNINEFLLKTKSNRRLMRILKFVWLVKTRHPTEARLTVLGVDPQFRKHGIASIFYFESLIRGRKRYRGGEMSWVEETNKEIIRGIEGMGGYCYKKYRLYEKPVMNA